jgi:hypothetical protein
MDSAEARSVLAAELARYRSQSYEALQRLLRTPDTYEVSGPSGTKYQVEIQAVWDRRHGGDLRVLGAIDDGGLRAFVPLTDDFIIAPNGTFVGE